MSKKFAVAVINPNSPSFGNWWLPEEGNTNDRNKAGWFDEDSWRLRSARRHVDDKRVAIVPVEEIDAYVFPGKKPALRPRNSAERKGEPIHSGVMWYFPDALAAVARVSKAGNDKHNPGEPLHWARGKSTDQLDAVARHLLTPEEIDPETNEAELAQAAWRALAELQLAEERRLTKAGIMPYSGIVPNNLPCPICKGVEGCDHTQPERAAAARQDGKG